MKPEDVERTRKVLKLAQLNTLDRLVNYVLENEHEITDGTQRDFDSSGILERLTGLHQEIFMFAALLGALPPPSTAPVARPKADAPPPADNSAS